MLARILTMIFLISISLAGCRGYIQGGSLPDSNSGGGGGDSVEAAPDGGVTVIKGRVVLPATPDASVGKAQDD